MQDVFYWLLTTGISAAGLAGALVYLGLWLRKSRHPKPQSPLVGHRPWRPVGAFLCGVASVLAYVGFHHVQAQQRPLLYLVIWGLVLAVLFCVSLMALVDILYTRRLLRQFLNRRDQAD